MRFKPIGARVRRKEGRENRGRRCGRGAVSDIIEGVFTPLSISSVFFLPASIHDRWLLSPRCRCMCCTLCVALLKRRNAVKLLMECQDQDMGVALEIKDP